MTTADIVRRLFGIETYDHTNRVTGTVGVAAVVIARADAARVFISITNNSAATLYVHTGNNVSANVGYVLPPATTISLNVVDDNMRPTREYWAVASAAASNITVVESIIASRSNI